MQSKILGVNNPLISVIIPVYNAEKYLHKCVDSVLAQTYKNLEIILVDDGSNDNSGPICDEYAKKDTRVKVIHQQNAGVSAARNKGLDAAHGQYIGFVDGDDYVEPDMYDYLLHLIQTNQADLARCEAYGFPTLSLKTVLSPTQALESFFPHLYLWNMLFCRKTVAMIKFDETIAFAEDMKFCVQGLGAATQVAYGPEPKYHYIRYSDSATNKPFAVKKLTYFKAAQFVLDYAQEHKLYGLEKKIRGQIGYHAVGFLRQIARSNFQDQAIITDLQHKVRQSIGLHLVSKHKLYNKLFALVCCVNFKLACWMYKKLV